MQALLTLSFKTIVETSVLIWLQMCRVLCLGVKASGMSKPVSTVKGSRILGEASGLVGNEGLDVQEVLLAKDAVIVDVQCIAFSFHFINIFKHEGRPQPMDCAYIKAYNIK